MKTPSSVIDTVKLVPAKVVTIIPSDKSVESAIPP